MLKFFRKIRFDLMENKINGKYLKYAIGEIALVVIGILIALQINNWNQNQQRAEVEISTLIALDSEFKINKSSLLTYLDGIKEMRLYADSLRGEIGPEMTNLSIKKVNNFLGFIGATRKFNSSIDVLKDTQASGKLNLISNQKIRRDISKWSSSLRELEGEENDWALEFSNQFIPFANKWIQWDDVDYLFNENDPRYFQSKFNVDPRLILQDPEFSNITSIQYWRIVRVQKRTDSLLQHTDNLLGIIEQELNK